MNECYHNSWLAGWMYEGDMNERRSWDRAPQLGQTPRAGETLLFSHPLFCTRSMLTAHSADDIHALCQSHDYAVLLRSQPVGRVVEDYFLCKTRVSQCVCRISYTCLAVRADYFHDGISPERYSACLHWCRSALGGLQHCLQRVQPVSAVRHFSSVQYRNMKRIQCSLSLSLSLSIKKARRY